MKLTLIILITLLTSCASVKVKGKICKSEFDCTEFSYWSKKDHPDGVTFKYKDIEFTSKASVAKSSPLEEAGIAVLKKALEKVEL